MNIYSINIFLGLIYCIILIIQIQYYKLTVFDKYLFIIIGLLETIIAFSQNIILGFIVLIGILMFWYKIINKIPLQVDEKNEVNNDNIITNQIQMYAINIHQKDKTIDTDTIIQILINNNPNINPELIRNAVKMALKPELESENKESNSYNQLQMQALNIYQNNKNIDSNTIVQILIENNPNTNPETIKQVVKSILEANDFSLVNDNTFNGSELVINNKKKYDNSSNTVPENYLDSNTLKYDNVNEDQEIIQKCDTYVCNSQQDDLLQGYDTQFENYNKID
jgi:hypothetical protein